MTDDIDDQITDLLATGQSQREVAATLNLTRSHVRSVAQSTGTHHLDPTERLERLERAAAQLGGLLATHFGHNIWRGRGSALAIFEEYEAEFKPQ